MIDWTLLLSTFGLVFLSELGDKTQLAVIAQTCKYQRHGWAVFLGASVALTAVTGIGAIVGQFLANWIPLQIIRLVAAAAFIVMGIVVAVQAARCAGSSVDGTCEPAPDTCNVGNSSARRAFGSTLALLFVAELGDKTQLAVLTMASQSGQVVPVFVGGAIALIAVSAIGVLGGQALCRVLPERLLLWLSATASVVLGVLMALGIL
jgi:putative Ca2+/H+ antiporter (TMEM165/GDT1 family)